MKSHKKTAVFLIIAVFMLLPAASGAQSEAEGIAGRPPVFSDVRETDWFKPYIDKMAEKGICNGYGDGRYGPNDKLQADQLIKLVVSALGYNLPHVEGRQWAWPYIDAAKKLGLVEDGEFTDYARNITRAEIARIIARSMEETFPNNLLNYKILIKDYKSIPSGCHEAILKVYCKGIVNGYADGRFGPYDCATRGEASKMIINLIEPSMRKIPELPTGTETVRGYTIPLNPATIIDAETDLCDISIFITVSKPLEPQFEEAYRILKSKFGNGTAETVMAYVKQKKDKQTELKPKTFQITGYVIGIVGGGMSMTINVYKK